MRDDLLLGTVGLSSDLVGDSLALGCGRLLVNPAANHSLLLLDVTLPRDDVLLGRLRLDVTLHYLQP